jgi:RNA-directed DNA polymerase
MRIPRKLEQVRHRGRYSSRGIISPALANWTLDGLESLLKKTFPSRKEKGRQIYSKVHLVRFADDTPVQKSNLRGASPLIPIVRSGI